MRFLVSECLSPSAVHLSFPFLSYRQHLLLNQLSQKVFRDCLCSESNGR